MNNVIAIRSDSDLVPSILPEDRNAVLCAPEAAPVAHRIFDLAAQEQRLEAAPLTKLRVEVIDAKSATRYGGLAVIFLVVAVAAAILFPPLSVVHLSFMSAVAAKAVTSAVFGLAVLGAAISMFKSYRACHVVLEGNGIGNDPQDIGGAIDDFFSRTDLNDLSQPKMSLINSSNKPFQKNEKLARAYFHLKQAHHSHRCSNLINKAFTSNKVFLAEKNSNPYLEQNGLEILATDAFITDANRLGEIKIIKNSLAEKKRFNYKEYYDRVSLLSVEPSSEEEDQWKRNFACDVICSLKDVIQVQETASNDEEFAQLQEPILPTSKEILEKSLLAVTEEMMTQCSHGVVMSALSYGGDPDRATRVEPILAPVICRGEIKGTADVTIEQKGDTIRCTHRLNNRNMCPDPDQNPEGLRIDVEYSMILDLRKAVNAVHKQVWEKAFNIVIKSQPISNDDILAVAKAIAATVVYNGEKVTASL